MTVLAEILRIRTPRQHRRWQIARTFEFQAFYLLETHERMRALRGLRLLRFWSTGR